MRDAFLNRPLKPGCALLPGEMESARFLTPSSTLGITMETLFSSVIGLNKRATVLVPFLGHIEHLYVYRTFIFLILL